MYKLSHIASVTFFVLLSAVFSFQSSFSQEEKPEKSIVVKDYSWRSGGMGQSAVLEEITLKNTSIQEFRNIEIELELYSNNDTPLGSLRGTIKDFLPAGSEKTFHNIDFGIMHSALEKSFARVVRAELIETGIPSHPSHLILVKNWEWTGGRYGTEGLLKEITVENRSDKNFKDIKIRVSDLGVSGPKVGTEGYTTNVVIHDVLPAKSTKTYKNINVGFRHPNATNTNVYVLDAKPISAKEMRYRLAKETEVKRKSSDSAKEDEKVEVTVDREPSQKKLTLAERYRKKLEEKEQDTVTESQETQPQETIETTAEVEDVGKETEIEKGTDDSTYQKPEEQEETKIASIDEEEVPLPKYDIEVKDFKWGSGVPGSLGTIKKLTLKNKSGIDYTRIELLVEFLSPQGVPLASNDLRIYEVLPAGRTREFENLNVGIISVLPDQRNIRITVKDATSTK